MCKAKFTLVSLNREGLRFHVKLDMLFICETVQHDSSLLFIPRLVGENRCIELPLILVAGKRRYWVLKRALWGLGKNILGSYKIQKVLKGINGRSISYYYRICLDYEDWMSEARINLS